MDRIEGTSARQLDLDLLDPLDIDEVAPVASVFRRVRLAQAQPALRLLRRDVYVELARRRRRAQIAARHELDRS